MIPKTIHYCWFGRKPKPKLAKKCIRSWKRYCKGWEIKEWNEDSIDFSQMPLYVRQAYDAKKWGFVPDYIRLWIIYNYGGIYLDTDVEIIRPLDSLLELRAFAGFESEKYVNFGQGFGAEKGNQILKRLMDSYDTLSFNNEDGSMNLTPSPQLNTKVLIEAGLQCNNAMQTLGGMTIFPTEYFCPRQWNDINVHKTNNTYTIHHFSASWFSKEELEKKRNREKQQRKNRMRYLPNRVLLRLLGSKNYEELKRTLKRG